MASGTTSKKMREEATCAICLQLMAEPVSISCGHSYCQACLLHFMGPASSPRSQQDMETFSCPQCRAPFQRGSLRPNKQLGSLIAALREQEQELSCQEHGERLHLFCEDEGQLICWRCERDPRHKGHATALVEDAGPGYREKLQEAVRNLRKLEEECASQKAFKAKQIDEWNEKTEAQRQKIQADFQNLHSFLREEERAYLWRLESEKELTLRRLRDSEAKLGQQSQELESRILEMEERCQGSAQKVLQDVKGALSRSQAVRLETPEAVSLEVQTECEVPELYFDLRKQLRSHQGPCEDGLPLSVFVWDFLNCLTELPCSCETDMEQFAETLRGRVTMDEALQEIVDVIYEQATSVPKFRCVGAHLCDYLSFHQTDSSQRGSFSRVFLQRLQSERASIDQAVEGDEAAWKQFHGFVLFLEELCLQLKIEGAKAQSRAVALRLLLTALLSNPVDDNLVCSIKLLEFTGPSLEDAWKEQGKTDMDTVIRRIANFALDTPCSADVRQMLLKLVELRSIGVTLDPETAHPELILSKDQRQVTRGGCPEGPGDPSPRRFTGSPCILGLQSFTSGRQYFEVDVGEGMGWDVGVCLESVQRVVGTMQTPEAGFWALRLCAKDGYVALTWPRTPLGLQEQPLVVGVLLDCEVGVVSFYNMTSGSHIFTFPRASFPDVLRPYFQVYPYSPLFLPSPDK